MLDLDPQQSVREYHHNLETSQFVSLWKQILSAWTFSTLMDDEAIVQTIKKQIKQWYKLINTMTIRNIE